MSPIPPIHALTLAELAALFAAHGWTAHQARLTFQNLHRHGARSSGDMRELGAACRGFLDTLPPLPVLRLETVHRSTDGTSKLRIQTPAGGSIEAVIIPTPKRVTLCVSSQVGCAAGCTFCHTATMGLLRNLEAWEIVEQHRLASALWACDYPGQPITNIVFMGMGEPLHNEASVAQACRILGTPLGAGLSTRHLVVSTAGVGQRIRPFWELNVGALAVSLHATTDELRDKIVPINRLCGLDELRRILLDIPWRRRESLTVAYLLLEDLNDSRDDARRLAAWIKGLPAKVNLLEFNPFPGSTFKRTSSERLNTFRQWLYELGVFNTLRHSRGTDALAACGQLAAQGSRKKVAR